MLIDSFDRTINNLRISVTDRCNFRCTYCMPAHGMVWLDKQEILTFEEIYRLAKIFAELGINKLRLTGGEPLIRKELHTLIKLLSTINNITDISLTTNGYLLEEQAEKLFEAGLNRVNVSLDSLRADNFRVITRRSYYEKVWRGIRKCSQVGFSPIKINVVLIRGFNDSEILDFAKLARTTNFIIRFIEFMPIGSDDNWDIKNVVTTEEIVNTIEHGLGIALLPKNIRSNQAADSYVFNDGLGEIGFISSISNPFCEHCNRIRITSDGKLRTCLFSEKETDFKQLLRTGASDKKITDLALESVLRKERGHLINTPKFVKPSRTMSQIGG